MEHEKNIVFQRFPLIKRISGIILLLVALYSALEWNEKTNSYWGYVIFAIAVPGIFYPLIQIVKKLLIQKETNTK